MMTVKDYNALVDEHTKGLYRFAYGYLKDSFEAENVVQNTFEKLWLKRDSIRPESLKAFLFKVAYNDCIDQIRKGNRKEALETVENQVASATDYSDAMQVIRKAAEKLPEKQKVVLMLRDYEGYDYKTIASITGMTEAQVKINIFRARQLMKSLIRNIHSLI